MGNSIDIGSGNNEVDIEQVSDGKEPNDVKIKNNNTDIKFKQDSNNGEKSKVLENIIYATVSILIALIAANYLIGTMGIEYEGYGMIVHGTGSFAVLAFIFIMFKMMRK